MTVAPAASSASLPPAGTATQQLDPTLASIIQQLPADKRQQILAQVAGLSPAQQQQLAQQVIAQTGAATAPAAGAAATTDAAAGAITASPPSKWSTVIKHVLGFGAAGAAIGFGASFATLPMIGPFSGAIGAAVGGAIGAVIGLVTGMRSASKKAEAWNAEQAAAQQAAVTTQVAPSASAGAPTDAPSGVDPDPPARKTYTVKSGDCLSTIAKRYGMTWQELYKANKGAVGSNPDLIHPGLKLVIPAH